MTRPSSPTDRRKVGEIRPSQLLYAGGVGAIVELPNLSVMVMGLDDWPVEQGVMEISEPRLLKVVRKELGPQVVKLLTPPVANDSAGVAPSPFDDTANVGVPVAPFPRWQVCPYCRLLAPIGSSLFELRLDPYRKDRSRFVHRICGNTKIRKPPTVVPARFLVACEHGHLDDFPWVEFVHRGKTDCRYELRLYELGASGEVADIQVECVKCEKKRRMSDAFGEEGRAELERCKGRWPHLRKFDEVPCEGRQRPILLGASNSWFPIQVTALSIPSTVDKLGQLVEWNWAELEECESPRDVKLKRKLLKGLSGFTDEQIFGAAEARKAAGDGDDEVLDLREPEWQVLSNPDPRLNGRDFRLRSVEPPGAYRHVLSQVVLAERLREVRALIGFTRIESPGDYTEMGDFPEEQRVPLSRSKPKWVPTSEIRGEGIFLRVSEDAIQKWIDKTKEREGEFFEAHRRWRQSRGHDRPDDGFPAMRYVLLHSLSHALIRQFAVECGYTCASIRERIYSRPPGTDQEPMAGILLYTAAPDSEGTLGGLVSLGDPRTLGRHLDQALEAMRLCASDPLCAEHHPIKDGLTLHGAACHACLFLPETSCERGNKYLDRSVLVSTVESDDLAFFAGFAEAIPEASITAETDVAATPPRPVETELTEADQLVDLCDERCQEFLRSWLGRRLPKPEVGYELPDGQGRVCAQAELAWPARKAAAVLPEGGDTRTPFEQLGWTVFDATDLPAQEARLRSLLEG